jgi:hypothetical protein
MKELIKKNVLILFLLFALPKAAFSAPSFSDIVNKGDRNLKIINNIYDKYPFMPAKKDYYLKLENKWIKDKTEYRKASSTERKNALDQVLITYRIINEVLKDICVDMANLTGTLMDDFAEKLVAIEAKRIPVKSEKYYNRYIVSQRQFFRAESGFKNSLFYYSASLYDHGIDLLISIYKENNWGFPGMPALTNNTAEKDKLS